ncbi:indole-3-glycerol-phosphate synthase [Bacillus benzoevorans]|uniref:indole-3-glycerol-phosphate synthase n=1 Tax=Bacillus benzoevorans TaxID=1456 RepID=A0A7X0HQA3_9BACI|nr:indole-3-glycerol-phosphate synthase [Bacillus benzoevorans]MBB6444953.1 indole-3-glycerol phosphate synthase [Bacillus benzoevorans]
MGNEEKNQNGACTKCTSALWKEYQLGRVPVIPDMKRRSPGEGDLMFGRNPVETAKHLEEAGAPVISVVTEAEHYGGSLDLLREISHAVSVPILRKDFIKTKEQLQESAEYGASGVLLISSILENEQLCQLIEEAKELGLEPLVETHDEAEILAVRDLNLSFIGINNRNIIQWEMDDGNVNTTETLAGLVPPGAFLLSESSISSPDDVIRAAKAGAHGVLVGTAIHRAADPPACYQNLRVWRG